MRLDEIEDKYFYNLNGVGSGSGFGFGSSYCDGVGFGFDYDINFIYKGLCKIGCITLPIKTWLGQIGKELAERHNVEKSSSVFIEELLKESDI